MAFTRKHDPAQSVAAGGDARAPAMSFSVPQQGQKVGMALQEQLVESVIGNDLSIEGDAITIRCKGSLTVNGNIQADLHSRRLQVGKDAVVSGAISADTVDVFGRVQGAILGAKVVLHTGADVEGDIMSQLLSVEEGANFDGRSRRVTDPAAIVPQLESTSKAADKSHTQQPFPMQESRPAGRSGLVSVN
jgi:cytoskeletal protein CcmA (bactofilin family)